MSSQPVPTNPRPEPTESPPAEPRPEPPRSEEETVVELANSEAFKLPDPDPDNITVLTDKLPNKPILPWNHYDSPGQEEEAADEGADKPEAADADEGGATVDEGDREAGEPEVDEVE